MSTPRAGIRLAAVTAAAEAAGPKVTYLFGRINRALRRRLIEVLRPLEVSVAQYTTLSVLRSRSNLSNAQLAKRAFITPQAMNEVMQGLEARRLVTRRASQSHGRIVQLRLTQKGLEILSACDLAAARLERAMLEALTNAERQQLGAALSACIKALEHLEPAL